MKTNKGPPKTNNGYFNLANPWMFIVQHKLNPVINIRVLYRVYTAALKDLSDRKLDTQHLPNLTYIYYTKYLSLADLKNSISDKKQHMVMCYFLGCEWSIYVRK